MVFSTRATRTAAKEEIEQIGETGTDSCPLLGEEEMLSQPHRIRDVRRIDNGILSPKRSLTQRVYSRKNRFVQRMLVACRLADPSKDLTFKQELASNIVATERLTTIRNSLFAHSQSIVSLSTAIRCFTGNSAHVHDDSQEALANIAAEGTRIHECSLVFSDQVEASVLAKINHRLAELERIRSLIKERAKLVLDVEYAKRKLAVEQQKGNVNCIADRKHELDIAQLECERATRFLVEQLKAVRPNQDTYISELFQEVSVIVCQLLALQRPLVLTLLCESVHVDKYAQLVAQFFECGVNMANGAKRRTDS